MIWLMIVWYLFGITVFLRTAWEISYTITVGDIFMSLLGGFFGPIILIFYLMFRASKENSWCEKVIWPRSTK